MSRPYTYNRGTHWFFFNLWATLSWIVLITASTAIISLPIINGYLSAKCDEYVAVQESIKKARKTHDKMLVVTSKDRLYNDHTHIENLEMRGIQVTIANWNGWRAFMQSIDHHLFMGFYIPDKIHHLKPME